MPQDDRDRFADAVRAVEYDIPETALRKWTEGSLDCQRRTPEERRYRFTFEGSTCTDGGAPYAASMQVVVRACERGVVVADALISFAESELRAARLMCEYEKRGERFLEDLQAPPHFCGRTLEEILAAHPPVNPAGCFCTEPMVNHKWRLALSAVHYALAAEAAAHASPALTP